MVEEPLGVAETVATGDVTLSNLREDGCYRLCLVEGDSS